MMPFFNRNWDGACGDRWAGPRLLASGTGGCRTVWVLEDGCNVGLRAPIKAPFCKNKEEGGSARTSPVAAPMIYRLCVVGPGVGLLLIGRLWMWHSPARRTRRKKGRRGLRPWPLRCLSRILPERKERMLRLLSIGVPFTVRMSMYL